MSADYVFTNDTGIISVDSSELLNDVETEWKDALGQDLDTDASTPQGTLIQNETLARTSVMKNNAELANVFNPSYSYGTFLDAVSALTGTDRGKNNKTLVRAVAFTGTAPTTIPAGSRVKAPNGNVFETLNEINITIPTVYGDLVSQDYGPVDMPVGSLTIIDGVIGWGGAYTDASSTVVLGTTKLSDPQLKVARRRRLYQQGVASLGAIYGRLLALDGVTSVMAIENDTGAPGTVNGITFSTPNGVWICVSGTATDQAIADTLWKAKQGGQPWDYGAAGEGNPVDSPNGVQVIDPGSKLPYWVRFNRPVMWDMYVQITVKKGTSIATTSDIQSAILDYSNGLINGEEGLVIGGDVSGFEIAAAVGFRYPGLYLANCKLAVVPAGGTPPSVYVEEWIPNPWDMAQINRGFIQVTVMP